MQRIDIRWLAGFVDGDGYIGIEHCLKGHRFTKNLTIYNTYLPILKAIQKKYGGWLGETSYRPERQKVCFLLRWHGDKANTLITNLLPHLRIKDGVAKVVLSFPKRKRRNGWKSNIVDLQKQLAILTRVKKLNNRGIPQKEN